MVLDQTFDERSSLV